MKKINLLLIACAISISIIYGCTSSGKNDITALDGKWILKTLDGNKIIKENTGGEMLFLNLNVKGNSVGGNTGCNDLGGKIVVTSGEIAFSDMSMTKLFCNDAQYEVTFVDYLFHSEPLKYKIDNNVLTFSKSGKVIMTFEKTK